MIKEKKWQTLNSYMTISGNFQLTYYTGKMKLELNAILLCAFISMKLTPSNYTTMLQKKTYLWS